MPLMVMLAISQKIPLTDEMMAQIFHMPLNTVRIALRTFVQLNMLEYADEEERILRITNWFKY